MTLPSFPAEQAGTFFHPPRPQIVDDETLPLFFFIDAGSSRFFYINIAKLADPDTGLIPNSALATPGSGGGNPNLEQVLDEGDDAGGLTIRNVGQVEGNPGDPGDNPARAQFSGLQLRVQAGDDDTFGGGRVTFYPGVGVDGRLGFRTEGSEGDLGDVPTAQGDGTAIWAPQSGGSGADYMTGPTSVTVVDGEAALGTLNPSSLNQFILEGEGGLEDFVSFLSFDGSADNCWVLLRSTGTPLHFDENNNITRLIQTPNEGDKLHLTSAFEFVMAWYKPSTGKWIMWEPGSRIEGLWQLATFDDTSIYQPPPSSTIRYWSADSTLIDGRLMVTGGNVINASGEDGIGVPDTVTGAGFSGGAFPQNGDWLVIRPAPGHTLTFEHLDGSAADGERLFMADGNSTTIYGGLNQQLFFWYDHVLDDGNGAWSSVAFHYHVDNEVLFGDVDGVNTQFSFFGGTPLHARAQVFVAGLLQLLGVDYTFDGPTSNAITFAVAPTVGPVVGFYQLNGVTPI